MKKYSKVLFIVAIIGILVSGGIYLYVMNTLGDFEEKGIEEAELSEDNLDIEDDSTEDTSSINSEDDNYDIKEDEDKTEEEDIETEEERLAREKREKEERERKERLEAYLKMVNESDRTNVLCLGVANGLADTMLVASFDTNDRLLDLIFIPRDTYHYREGYTNPGQKKINASYTGRNTAKRAQSSMNSVRDMLNIPIHDFVKVDYEGVEKIIDTVGGVIVTIPFDMDYDDPVSDLHIHFRKGRQLLDGEESVKFLRFRKNNDNTHSDGDIGRINRQKQFILNAIDKSLGLDLIKVVNTAKNHVRTSMTGTEIINNAIKFKNIKDENINVYILPGRAKYKNGLSYYFHDEEETMELITKIYQK